MNEHERVLDPARDPAAMKALGHPLRVRLLGLLRQDGPATASELAVQTGESSASTSYHLRVLAKSAFVAEAEHRDGRERRWRAVHTVTSWSNTAMAATPEARDFLGRMRRRQIDHLGDSLIRHEADVAAGRLGPEWTEPSGISDLMCRLTPGSLAELWEVIERKVTELTLRDADDPRAEQVVFVAAGLPVAPTEPGTPNPDDTKPDDTKPDDTKPDAPEPDAPEPGAELDAPEPDAEPKQQAGHQAGGAI